MWLKRYRVVGLLQILFVIGAKTYGKAAVKQVGQNLYKGALVPSNAACTTGLIAVADATGFLAMPWVPGHRVRPPYGWRPYAQ